MAELTVRKETWPFRGRFAISRGARTEAHVVVAELARHGVVGRGECVPYPRCGESVEGVMEAIRALAPAISDGLDREALQEALPPGAARNALDCAFWDLEAKATGRRAWDLADLPAPEPLTTAFTLGVDTPEAMGAAAAKAAARPLLKIKLTGAGDLDRVAAVRQSAPKSRLVVDANEAWTVDDYRRMVPRLAELGVAMIEQPLPAGNDGALTDLDHPVPLCADESCHDRPSLAELAGRYEMINIKLDKTGGLTEALALKAAAVEAGFQIMVGCMVGTSLAMAPAILVAQGAAVTDLDGPLLLAEDRPEGLRFDVSTVYPPDPGLWG